MTTCRLALSVYTTILGVQIFFWDLADFVPRDRVLVILPRVPGMVG